MSQSNLISYTLLTLALVQGLSCQTTSNQALKGNTVHFSFNTGSCANGCNNNGNGDGTTCVCNGFPNCNGQCCQNFNGQCFQKCNGQCFQNCNGHCFPNCNGQFLPNCNGQCYQAGSGSSGNGQCGGNNNGRPLITSITFTTDNCGSTGGGDSPGGAPNSPGGAPNSPGGAPNSPGGAPNSPGGAPNSPGGAPNSPGGAPNSPGVTPNFPGGNFTGYPNFPFFPYPPFPFPFPPQSAPPPILPVPVPVPMPMPTTPPPPECPPRKCKPLFSNTDKQPITHISIISPPSYMQPVQTISSYDPPCGSSYLCSCDSCNCPFYI